MWRNDQGDVVDPAPFVVSSLLSVMVGFSFGPVYAMEYGLTLEMGLVVSGFLVASTIVFAYHQLVWRSRPAVRSEVPVDVRLQRIFYAVIVGILVLSALTYPIVAGGSGG